MADPIQTTVTADCPHHSLWSSYYPGGPSVCQDCGAAIPSKPTDSETTGLTWDEAAPETQESFARFHRELSDNVAGKSQTTKPWGEDQATIRELRDALQDCLTALGHVGVRSAYERNGSRDPAAARFLLQIQATEDGGLAGVCERAFTKAQHILRKVQNV